MRNFAAFLSGGLFGGGLMLSGMTDTQKVKGWLDVFGAWDPTLAFVMGGAILPMAIAWRIAAARKGPILGGSFPEPNRNGLDLPLIVGSVIFGAGWALAGFCPGPALASISHGGWPGLLFLVAMLAGMFAAPGLRNRIARAPGASDLR